MICYRELNVNNGLDMLAVMFCAPRDPEIECVDERGAKVHAWTFWYLGAIVSITDPHDSIADDQWVHVSTEARHVTHPSIDPSSDTIEEWCARASWHLGYVATPEEKKA